MNHRPLPPPLPGPVTEGTLGAPGASSAPPEPGWSGAGSALPPPIAASEGSRLTPSWRWALAGLWLLVMVGVGMVADVGVSLGNEPFWLSTYVLPFLVPVATLVALVRDWRHTLALSFASAGVLAVIAAVDLADSPGIAAAELVLAAVAALGTAAAAAARTRRP